MNDLEDFKGADTGAKLTDMHIIKHEQWPNNATPDGKLYSLECSRAMRALMADDDTSAEEFELDDEGAIQWVPAVASNGFFEQSEPELSKREGAYQYIAEAASRLNQVQHSRFGSVTWLYAPVLIEPQAVA